MPEGNYWVCMETSLIFIFHGTKIHGFFSGEDLRVFKPLTKPEFRKKKPSDFWSSWNLCMMFCSSCSALSMARLQNTASDRQNMASCFVDPQSSPWVSIHFNTKMAYWDDDDQIVLCDIGFWGMAIAPWMGFHWILLKNGLLTPPRGPWHNMSHQDSQVHGSIHDPNGLKW